MDIALDRHLESDREVKGTVKNMAGAENTTAQRSMESNPKTDNTSWEETSFTCGRL